MRNPTILLLAFVVCVCAACSDTNDADTAATTVEEINDPAADSAVLRQPQDASSYFTIPEIGVGSVGFVALQNITSQPVSLDGLYLCNGSDCVELSDTTVEPGSLVRVAVDDGSDLDDVVMPGAALGSLDPVSGEVALYSSPEVDSSEDLIVYVQWGANPHDRTDDAVDKGLWVDGAFAPTAETATRLYRQPDSGLWLFEPND